MRLLYTIISLPACVLTLAGDPGPSQRGLKRPRDTLADDTASGGEHLRADTSNSLLERRDQILRDLLMGGARPSDIMDVAKAQLRSAGLGGYKPWTLKRLFTRIRKELGLGKSNKNRDEIHIELLEDGSQPSLMLDNAMEMFTKAGIRGLPMDSNLESGLNVRERLRLVGEKAERLNTKTKLSQIIEDLAFHPPEGIDLYEEAVRRMNDAEIAVIDRKSFGRRLRYLLRKTEAANIDQAGSQATVEETSRTHADGTGKSIDEVGELLMQMRGSAELPRPLPTAAGTQALLDDTCELRSVEEDMESGDGTETSSVPPVGSSSVGKAEQRRNKEKALNIFRNLLDDRQRPCDIIEKARKRMRDDKLPEVGDGTLRMYASTVRKEMGCLRPKNRTNRIPRERSEGADMEIVPNAERRDSSGEKPQRRPHSLITPDQRSIILDLVRNPPGARKLYEEAVRRMIDSGGPVLDRKRFYAEHERVMKEMGMKKPKRRHVVDVDVEIALCQLVNKTPNITAPEARAILTVKGFNDLPRDRELSTIIHKQRRALRSLTAPQETQEDPTIRDDYLDDEVKIFLYEFLTANPDASAADALEWLISARVDQIPSVFEIEAWLREYRNIACETEDVGTVSDEYEDGASDEQDSSDGYEST